MYFRTYVLAFHIQLVHLDIYVDLGESHPFHFQSYLPQ